MTMEQGKAKRIAEVAEQVLIRCGGLTRQAGLDIMDVPYVAVTTAVMAICKIRDNERLLPAQINPLAQYITESLVISLRKNGFHIEVPPDNDGKIIGSPQVFNA